MHTREPMRCILLKVIGTVVISLALPGCASGSGRSLRTPNIVFILADDQGRHQVGCYGNDFYETPNLDRLAAEGMRFTDAYAACAVCSPTRASIMTGKYPARLHLTDYIPGQIPRNPKLKTPDWTQFLPLKEVTIAEALKPAGYVSGHFGKWHLNRDKHYRPGRAMDPGSQGFDEVFTTVKPSSDADPLADPHHVKEITDRAIAFIENHKKRPFFCYVTHNSIHNPKMERPDLVAKYRAKPGSGDPKNNPIAGAMVETLDKSVGRILDALDELEIADHTLVMYFSDNGGIHAQDELKPLRGGKGQFYEGGIREPLIVRWPGVVRPGTRCEVPVSSIDFFPTLVRAAGLLVADPKVDGESLVPLLMRTGGLAREAIYWHFPHYHSSGIAPCGVIRLGRYKLIEWYERSIDGIEVDGALELFDLEKDISEQNDLVKKIPKLASRLYKKLKAWRVSVNAQEMTADPDYDPTRPSAE